MTFSNGYELVSTYWARHKLIFSHIVEFEDFFANGAQESYWVVDFFHLFHALQLALALRQLRNVLVIFSNYIEIPSFSICLIFLRFYCRFGCFGERNVAYHIKRLSGPPDGLTKKRKEVWILLLKFNPKYVLFSRSGIYSIIMKTRWKTPAVWDQHQWKSIIVDSVSHFINIKSY